jgi:hypothetical protein
MLRNNAPIAACSGLLSLLCGCTTLYAADLVINEFMADNSSTTNDPQGQYADWVEIYNSGASAIDIGGMYITDDFADATKYRIPTTNAVLTTIAAGGHLLLWADNDSEDGILHLEIGLDADGEGIALVDTDGATGIDSIVFGAQTEDISYGRYPDGGASWYAMPNPSPGAANLPGMANNTAISPSGTTFTNEITVTLTASNATKIYYTTDGYVPTTNSLEYAGAVTTNATVQIRAAAYQTGMFLGQVASENYIKLDADVLTFTSDLPVVVLENFGAGNIPVQDAAGTRQFAYLGIFEPTNGLSSLTNSPNVSSRAGITRRGESSLRNTDRRPNMSVEAWSEYEDADADISPLGMPAQSDWILYRPLGWSGTDAWDDAGVRNSLMFELSNQLGRYAMRTRFVAVFLNYNGGSLSTSDFNGVYVFMEKIKKDDNRVDVETLDPSDTTEPDITGGYMFKIDKPDPDAVSFNAAGQNYYWVYPRGDEMTSTMTLQADWLKSHMNEYDSALDGPDYQNPTNGYAKYIKVNSWIDHNLLNMLAKNVDALRLSTYLHKKRDEKIEMGPIWDFDRSMESTDGRDNQWNTWYSSNGDSPYFDWGQWGRLFDDVNFQQKYLDRWWDLREDVFSVTNVMAIIDQQTNAMYATQVYDPRADPSSWEPRVDRMVGWVSNRLEWIDGKFIAPPGLSHEGGLITNGYELAVTWPTTAVDKYYTVDGTDPRATGGGVSPGAQVYSAPVTLTNNTILMARARNTSWSMIDSVGRGWGNAPWGGLTEAIFIIKEPEFAITEVMFHARDPQAGTTEINYTTSDFDYIELQNVGSETHSLLGVKLTDGIEFDFSHGNVTNVAPGEFVLVVEDFAAFSERYTNWATLKIAGEYNGDLADAGEQVRLKGPTAEKLSEFEYDDARGWPVTADGAGHSLVPLVLSNQQARILDYSGNWRASAFIDGSPGETDPDPAQSIVINEIAAHTDTGQPAPNDSDDWIELYNPLSTSVNIGGWWLSDNGDDLQKYQVLGGTVLASGAFIKFSEDLHFHTNRFDGSGFGLDKSGERVYLTHMPGSPSNRVVDAVRFKAQENGVTLGRYPNGDSDWYALSPTPAAANAAPGSHVVISEIMYHPAPTVANPENNTNDEYVKIYNPLFVPVQLWTTAGVWRIDGGIGYVFPTNTTLAAKGELVLVSFDPATNTVARDEFLAHYDLDIGDVTLLGPYSDQLDNQTDRVALEKPLEPDPPEIDVSWVIVDEVIYYDSAPWPTLPDGTGPPLYRTDFDGAGNDPASWTTDPPGADTFEVTSLSLSGGTPLVTWQGLTNGEWYVERSTNLSEGFTRIATTTVATVYHDTALPASVSESYYRISVRMTAAQVYTRNTAGYFQHNLPSNGYSLISVPFQKFPLYRGVVSSNTALTITDDDASWTTGEFAQGAAGQEPTGTNSFYVEIRDKGSALEGKMFPITTNSTTELQIEGGAAVGLAADALAGVSYAIVPEQRVRDIFGEPESPLLIRGADVQNTDNVLFWSGTSWQRIYNKDSGNPVFLQDHWLLGNTVVDDKAIGRDTSFFLFRQATSNTILHLVGEVPAYNQWIDLEPGYNLVGGSWIAPVSIGNTSLQGTLSGGVNSSSADTILEWSGSSWLGAVYYKTSGNPPFLVNHWVRGSTIMDSSFTLMPARGYFIENSSSNVWHKARRWND